MSNSTAHPSTPLWVTLSLPKGRRFVIVLFSLLWSLPLSAATDKATVKEFVTEPATLLSLGFEWRIDGDDNRNATVCRVLPQEGRAGVEGRPAAAPHRPRADQRERAPIHHAEHVRGQHLRSGT